MGQEWLGPAYFFISLVLGPLNSLLEESTDPNRYTAKAKFCFCKNNKRMIIGFTLSVNLSPPLRLGSDTPPRSEECNVTDKITSLVINESQVLYRMCRHFIV